MNKLKRVGTFCLALIMLVATGTATLAVEPPQEAIISLPTSEYNPAGNLSEEEISLLQEKLEDAEGRHFHLMAHTHSVIRVTRIWNGQRARGRGVATTGRVDRPTELRLARTFSVQNNWNASIGFATGPITAEVGFGFGNSYSREAAYTLHLARMDMGAIYVYDMSRVTDMDVRTTWFPINLPPFTEDGTAWAEQWTHFGFRGVVW